MALRYRRSKKILPGVRLNINKNSVGLTLGGKGLRYTVNSKGRRTTTVGIPGTGISYSKSSTVRKETQDNPVVQDQKTTTPICELCHSSTVAATVIALVCGIWAFCLCFSKPGIGNTVFFAVLAALFYAAMVSRDAVKTSRKIVKLYPEVAEGPLDPPQAEDALIILNRGLGWRTIFTIFSILGFFALVMAFAVHDNSGATGGGNYFAQGIILLVFGGMSICDVIATMQAKLKLKMALKEKDKSSLY